MSNIIAGPDGRHYLIENGGVRAMDVSADALVFNLMPPGDVSVGDMDGAASMFRPPGADDGPSSATLWCRDTDGSISMFRA
jgi:hypothetical protein